MSMCILHVSRTGSHAIQNWLCLQLDDVQVHVDWCPTFHGKVGAGRRFLEYKGGKLCRDHMPNRNSTPSLRLDAKQVVMVENFDLNGWSAEKFNGAFDEVWAVCRDPYNWLASSVRRLGKTEGRYLAEGRPQKRRDEEGFTKWYGTTMGRCDMWVQAMRHVMGEENLIGQLVGALNYNRWCVDKEYRRDLAYRLGVSEFTDMGFDMVPPHGGGSSWTGKNKLKGDNLTLNRFRQYVDNEKYRAFVSDEMVRIGKEFFGMERPW